MSPFKPIQIKPHMGGRLVTGASADSAGIYNYTIKRDFRRYLDAEVLSEGYDVFAPDPANPEKPPTRASITLTRMLRRGNGQIAIVVGTKTTLWRYFGKDNGAYFLNGYIDPAYFDSNPGTWIKIGDGFSDSGRRWECAEIAGYLVLNNAVDLPITYRVEDRQVYPIYELREQGIASVGTIVESDGILVCMDIREIDADRLVEIMTPIAGVVNASVPGCTMLGMGTVNSGAAGVEGNKLTVTGFVLTGREGQSVRLANGLKRNIVTVVSTTVATLDGDADLAEPSQPVYLVSDSDNIVAPAANTLFPSFDGSFTGLSLFWGTGEHRVIQGLDNSGCFIVDSDSPVPSGPVSIENPAAYAAFTEDQNINYIRWRKIWSMPSAPRRFGSVIPCTITPGSDTVELHYPVKSLSTGQSVLITGAGAGGGNLTGEILFVTPKRFVVGGGLLGDQTQVLVDNLADIQTAKNTSDLVVTSTSATLSLAIEARTKARAKSDDSPDDAALKADAATASAAVDTARASYQAAVDKQAAAVKALADAQTAYNDAVEILADSTLMAADAFGSITGKFEDLEDDGSAILKGAVLRGVLVIYKETSIFVSRFTGDLNTPWVSERIEIQPMQALAYRDSVALLNDQAHIYIGQNGFWRFDLTNRTPMEAQEFIPCKDLFFNTVNVDPDSVFCADNPLTGEIWWAFDSIENTYGLARDRVIRFDYRASTISTSPLTFSAAARVLRPDGGIGPHDEEWFIMGSQTGTVLRYGMTNKKPVLSVSALIRISSGAATASVDFFTPEMVGCSIMLANRQLFAITGYADAKNVTVLNPHGVSVVPQPVTIISAIYHRSGQAYTGYLQSGLDAFGNPNAEKETDGYVLFLASDSPEATINVVFRGGINTEGHDIMAGPIPHPRTQNMLPASLCQYFIGDRIEVSGVNHLVKIVGRMISITGINSESFMRHV